VAYRNLAGMPVQPSEEEALWGGDERLLTGHESVGFDQRRQALQAETHPDWELAWVFAIGGEKAPEPSSFVYSFGFQPWAGIYRQIALHESNTVLYSQFLNCPQDAFREAVNTLKLRSQQFGQTSPIVQDWIKAQEMVFENCGAGSEIPEALPPGAPAIARADRAYQIAAAHFYAGDYDGAISDFRTIARDPSSPWNTITPYLVARTLVRKATVNDRFEPDLAALAPAETQIESVLADPRLAQYHRAAEQLRGFIELRLHPDRRIVELADNLTGKVTPDPNLAQDLTDFRLLLGRAVDGEFYRNPQPVRSDMYTTLAEVRAKSDLLDWMLTLRLDSAGAYGHALEKWEGSHSVAWLVAALTKAVPGSPHAADLLAAARQVSPHSPAYDSVTFHGSRLMLLQGKDSEVREQLAHLQIRQMGTFPANSSTPPSTVNLFLALRFELAQNLDELFENALRVPATITSSDSPQQLPALILPSYSSFDETVARLDDDSLVVLNHFLPVTMLAKAVSSPKLPNNLRGEFALAAWTRATLLGKAGVAHSLAVDLESYVPELKESVQAYNSAATPEAQRFAAAFATLRFPGLSPFIATLARTTPIEEIDNLRANWWDQGGPPCIYPRAPIGANYQFPKPPDLLNLWPKTGPVLRAIYPGGQVKPPGFLTAKERSEAEQELRQLVNLGPAPNYLSKEVIAWAKTHPGDPRVPEALALAVKSTRYGCTDQETGQFSKAAFDLLHHCYPNSSWAQQTKYWFKG
jgi:hypothetical protein